MMMADSFVTQELYGVMGKIVGEQRRDLARPRRRSVKTLVIRGIAARKGFAAQNLSRRPHRSQSEYENPAFPVWHFNGSSCPNT
jgi:hypothetical protein